MGQGQGAGSMRKLLDNRHVEAFGIGLAILVLCIMAVGFGFFVAHYADSWVWWTVGVLVGCYLVGRVVQWWQIP
jgi:hypothetical protein